MDRKIVYPYEQLADTDILQLNKGAYIALSKLASAILGTSTLLNGFTCTQTSPASMSVEVSAGEMYSLQATDATPYGSIPADAEQIVKQGISSATTVLNCSAPTTPGFSINYLVQIAFLTTDTDSGSRQFKNPDTGQITTLLKNQTRKDGVNITLKAGAAAETGSQNTPTPDAGYTGIWVITVDSGQSAITNSDISVYPGANFITERLTDKISLATGDERYLQSSSFPNIAFRAELGSNFSYSGLNAQLIPNVIIYNYSDAYNPSTGKFQPSVAGIYKITVGIESTVSDGPSYAGGTILKNVASIAGHSIFSLGPGSVPACTITADIFLNGSTDYIQFNVGTTASSAAVKAGGESFASAYLVKKI